MRRLKLAIALYLAMTPALSGLSGSAEPRLVIEGRVLDRLTRDPLPFARVIVDEAQVEAGADSVGRFHIPLDSGGVYRVRASAALHEPSPWSIVRLTREAPSVRIDLELDPQIYRVPTVEVYGERFRPELPDPPSRLLLASDIRRATGGFQDPLRALQESGAIESRNDLGTLLSIRGGEPDQILFLMDGLDVYNPYRMRIVLGGGLSLANPDLVESVELYAGGFSARYGNRTSGLIHLRTREGNRQQFRSRHTLSLIAASTAIEGPLPHELGSWILGMRRTYYDLVLHPPKGEGTQYPYLQEIQGRIDWDMSSRQRLTMRCSAGNEGMNVLFRGEEEEQDADTEGNSTTASASLEHAATVWDSVRSLTRIAILGDRTRLNIFGIDDQSTYADARTRELRFSSSHEWEVTSPPHLGRIGIVWDRYRSGIRWKADADPSPSINPVPDSLRIDDGLNYRAAYIEDLIALRGAWVFSLGLRFEDADGPSPLQLSPRIALRGEIHPALRLRLGVGHYLQYPNGIQSFSRESPLSIRSFSDLTPEKATLASAGVSGGLGRLSWDAEFYSRDTEDLLVPLDRSTYTAAADGRALARGIETEVGLKPAPHDGRPRRRIDDIEIHLSHAWIDSRFRGGVYEKWARVSAERGKSFLARTRFPIRENVQVSFLFRLASGAPYTSLLGRVTHWDESGTPSYTPIWDDPLGSRTSPYARLDARIERAVTFFGRRGAVFLEVMNLTNRRNTVSMVWNNRLDRRRPVRGLPLLPFLGMSIWG